MHPLISVHEVERGKLQQLLEERSRSFVTVYGESGVGKTTMIDQLLSSIGFADKTLRYEAANSTGTLKGYLNSLFSRYHTDAGILKKVLNTKLQFSSAKIGIGIPTSLSVKQTEGGVTVQLGGRHDQIQLAVKSSTYRLNGSAPSSFFKRLWSLLNAQGIHVLWLANSEFLSGQEIQLLSGICQYLPTGSHVIVEVGGFGRQFEKTHDAINECVKSCPIAARPIHVPRLSLEEAKRFHQMISVSLALPPFDYAKNGGNPLSIIYDISFAREKYAVSRTITKFARNRRKKHTLLLLAALHGIVQDYELFARIAAEARTPLDTTDLIHSGIVEHIGSRIFLAHTMFADFLLSEFRSDLSQLIRRISSPLRRHDRSAYLYLALRYSNLIGPISDKDCALLKEVLITAISNYDISSLSNLLPWTSTVEDLPEDVRYVYDFVSAQYDIYQYDFAPSRISRYSGQMVSVAVRLLTIQSLYHKNRFVEAVAFATSNETARAVASLKDPNKEIWALGILEALIGVCYIAIGDHAHAKESLAAAMLSSPRNTSRGQYLLLLENFLYGNGYSSLNAPVASELVQNNYIRAKLNHNIYSSKICNDFSVAGLTENLVESVIAPLVEIRCQEVTYSYINLGALHIARGNFRSAIDLLEQTKLRVFEIYDAVACLNNLIVANALNGTLEKAQSYYAEFLSTIRETQFNDPSFLVKPRFNMAVVARQMGRTEDATRLLAECTLPESHVNFGILEEKIKLLADFQGDIGRWPNSGKNIFSRYVYWVQIMTFWDYNAPIIDKDFFEFTNRVRPRRSSEGRTNSRLRQRPPHRKTSNIGSG